MTTEITKVRTIRGGYVHVAVSALASDCTLLRRFTADGSPVTGAVVHIHRGNIDGGGTAIAAINKGHSMYGRDMTGYATEAAAKAAVTRAKQSLADYILKQVGARWCAIHKDAAA